MIVKKVRWFRDLQSTLRFFIRSVLCCAFAYSQGNIIFLSLVYKQTLNYLTNTACNLQKKPSNKNMGYYENILNFSIDKFDKLQVRALYLFRLLQSRLWMSNRCGVIILVLFSNDFKQNCGRISLTLRAGKLALVIALKRRNKSNDLRSKPFAYFQFAITKVFYLIHFH